LVCHIRNFRSQPSLTSVLEQREPGDGVQRSWLPELLTMSRLRARIIAWSLFLLDHRRHVDVVSRKIRDELRTRQDVYAYDLLAWSLHVQGRDAEAKPVMLRALPEGTHGALLDNHLAAIDAAVVQRGAAR
jgi:hypothetical protein